jgi:hypothetical protein
MATVLPPEIIRNRIPGAELPGDNTSHLGVAISVLMTQSFDQDILKAFDQTAEIDIETSRGEGAPVHRTTIWIVVDGDSAYVRSVRGPAGRWFREMVANPMGAVHVGGRSVPVQAQAASDPASVARVSDAVKAKYEARWPGPTASMLRDETLPTTLRLEPR